MSDDFDELEKIADMTRSVARSSQPKRFRTPARKKNASEAGKQMWRNSQTPWWRKRLLPKGDTK